MKIDRKTLNSIIKNAILEDKGPGDITTDAIISGKNPAIAIITAKQEGVICGQEIAREVFKFLNDEVKYRALVRDGNVIKKGDKIAQIRGDIKTLLTGERVALNFLMHLSGIASLTKIFVEKSGKSGAVILDTRKTVPGLRLMEKYAVKCGGGSNHRIGLYDMFLIKDNHIEAAGSVESAIRACKKYRGRKRTKIEIECANFGQIREALQYGPERIMLDNMTPARMKKAVEIIKEHNPEIETEASGNVSLKNIAAVSKSGVDFISIGKLTHSAPALDLSMEIQAYAG